MHEGKMKRWAVFAHDDEPLGGMGDFEAAFETREEAEQHVLWRNLVEPDIYIVDMMDYLSDSYDCWNEDIYRAITQKEIAEQAARAEQLAARRITLSPQLKALNNEIETTVVAMSRAYAKMLYGDGNG